MDIKKLKRWPLKVLVWGIALLYIIPLLMIVTNSFMTQQEINRRYSATYTLFDHELKGETHYAEYGLIPERISIDQYNTLLFKTPVYLDLFLNSVKLTVPIVLIQVLVGSMAAYCFTVWKCRYKEVLFCLYIIVMILPYQATLVSNYIIADKLAILNNHLAIILPLGFSPFAVFVMRQSMRGIPADIFNAAAMDGANHWQKQLYIAMPMSKGGIASLAILSFADCWGMVEQPMIFLKDAAKQPLSLALSQIGQESMGLIFAASVFYMLPVVWVFVYGQEYFEQGIKLSALK